MISSLLGPGRGFRFVALLIAASGCLAAPVPESGLVVSIESELAIPKDIDRIRIEVIQDDMVLQSDEYALGAGRTLIPAQLRIRPLPNARPAQVRGVALQRGKARIERHAILSIPAARLAQLRMPFNYLCDGMTNPDGSSSCADGQTCKQGTCSEARLASSELEPYMPADGATIVSSTDPKPAVRRQAQCFDVMACFDQAAVVGLDAATCAFTLPAGLDPGMLNVAFALPASDDGVCDHDGCFVVLDGDAWTVAHDRVLLPEPICRELSATGPRSVALSFACATKRGSMPVCGAWSSAAAPLVPAAGASAPESMANACSGRPSQACGDLCGTQQRSCVDGAWSPWSEECTQAGPCTPGQLRPCGDGKTEICTSRCHWGECGEPDQSTDDSRNVVHDREPAGTEPGLADGGMPDAEGAPAGQGEGGAPQDPDTSAGPVSAPPECVGSASQACGLCGMQTRSCEAGVWSDFGPCMMAPDACEPGASEECPAGGVRTCGDNCTWGGCVSKACDGEPGQPCGNCGTQSRDCDPNTGMWSEWGECKGEGMCKAGDSRDCGAGMKQACGDDCRWAEACGSCPGTADCAPGQTRACGNRGTQRCGADCHWASECTGQSCSGALREACGNCGVRTRSCDTNTGRVTDWGACMGGDGECSVGMMRPCGSGGTQTCSAQCRWSECGCAGDTQLCGTSCVDTDTDRAHCGDCDTRCGADQTCVGGKCTCMRGLTKCGDTCVNTQTDPMHCGGCDVVPCGDEQTCAGGVCHCPDGLTDCYRQCVNTQRDLLFCGSCNTNCTLDQYCNSGICHCGSNDEPMCGGYCCLPSETCVNNMCQPRM